MKVVEKMPTSLQTSMLFTQAENPNAPKHPLRIEYGWREVSGALTKILLGYFILVVGCIAGACVFVVALRGRELEILPKGTNKNTVELVMWVGGLLLAASSLISYGMVMVGKWRCLMNAPERRAAKWLMFTCILCMLVGPVMQVMFSVGGEGADNFRALKKGEDGVEDVKFEAAGAVLQLVGLAISLSSTVLFVLFLRAVGSCFNNTALVNGIHLYLLYLALLVGGTVKVTLGGPRILMKPDVLMVLGFGWLGFAVGYVLIIVATRICILNGLTQVRSPVAPPAEWANHD
jgi:hypothetical protein